MKKQQLFYSFLPSVTAAVLTTQPAWANEIKIADVKLKSVPSELISTNPGNSFTDYNLLPKNKVNTNLGLLPPSYLSQASNPPFGGRTLPPIIADSRLGMAGENTYQKDESRFVTFSELSNSNPRKVIVSSSQSNNLGDTQQEFSSSDTKVSKLIEASQCPQQQAKTGAALLVNANNCLPPTSGNLIAQTTIPTTSEKTTAPTTENVNSAPSQGVDFSSKPPNTPNNLNPSPNPLLYPTQADEVKIQGTQAISLAEALELAKRNNNELQGSILELERTKAALREAQAALLPTVDLSADIINSRDVGATLSAKQRQEVNPSAPDATSSTAFTGNARIKYDLYTSGRRKYTIKEAEERIRFQELDVETKSEQLRLDVARAYYNLQQADENVRISQSAVENAQASLKDANALERAGVGTRFDVLRSQVNLANAQQKLTQALSDKQIARRNLAPLLNLPQSVSIRAGDPVKLAGLWQHPLEQSIILAYQNRPELQQQLAQRNIGEAQKKQALSALGPEVSLVGQYNLFDRFNDILNVVDGYSVGVQATLRLYDGGAAKARAAQAQKRIAIAETGFSEEKNKIRLQVEQAYYTQSANLENVQTSNVALEQAKESLRLARLRFQAGVGTQTDVINAENDLTQSEANRLKAIIDYNRALTELQRAVTMRGLNQLQTSGGVK
ncbi:TolC family protein [Cuspidothrix issatschenkoi]|uniref:Transporter n=1 Tax=Cuspidothrix issatschenkoi CHARLIE-1 TaxID=2052836 RepID=A0A2S6CS60_9CYAN|nr:TolC family protein [Cuspidothrix issatschenkoi]PPJ62539.1 transporter [Cuspidothrix issatschenkoi CHARLIE-1]